MPTRIIILEDGSRAGVVLQKVEPMSRDVADLRGREGGPVTRELYKGEGEGAKVIRWSQCWEM